MALQPVAGVARCVFAGISGGQPIINVMHVQNGGPGGPAYTQSAIDQLATSLASLYTGNLMPLVNNNYAAVGVTCTDLSSDLGVVGVAPMTGTGTNSGSGTTNGTAVVISWKIARHYRGGHPRTYLPAPASANITNPTSFLGTYVTTVNNAATAFRTAVNALIIASNTQRLCTVHRISGGAELPVPTVDVIIGNSVDTRIDTQRRRLGRDR